MEFVPPPARTTILNKKFSLTESQRRVQASDRQLERMRHGGSVLLCALCGVEPAVRIIGESLCERCSRRAERILTGEGSR